MPSNGKLNMWYSFTVGKARFIQISTETDYPDSPKNCWRLGNYNGNFGNQLEWLENELIEANKNRNTIPWIIVSSHRPIYSTKNYNDIAVKNSFEKLFYKYKVDIIFSGHVHHYERQYPTYDNNFNISYVNPEYPVYIISGSGGCIEGLHTVFPYGRYRIPEWNAMYSVTYGAGILIVEHNKLVWNYYNSYNQLSIDSITITK